MAAAAASGASVGLRCVGSGAALRCARRDRLADPFVCTNGSCVQRHPRLPDDGEWACIDLVGAVLCRGGETASGVPPGPPEPGWICGQRRGTEERLCLDRDPDLPAGGPHACHFEHVPRDTRHCEPPKAPLKGPTFAADPTPECWFDADCGGPRCLLGRCGT
jgi:hypothetical protein